VGPRQVTRVGLIPLQAAGPSRRSARYAWGVTRCQRLNARWNAAGSE
jgi:hypothetical protein